MSYIVYEDQIEAKELPGRSLKWLFTPETGQTKNFTMNVVSIKPGSTVKPAHSHPSHEEVVYIISGSGKAFIDGKAYEISEGTAVLFSPGSIHMLRNTGKTEMKVACFFTPPATLENYTFHEDVEFPEY
jgi:quercetin dioxygenase-like cupin family protein